MARGKKTSDEKKERVRAVLYLNPDASIRDITRQTGIPESTVRGIRDECMQSDEYTQVREQKKREFIDAAWAFIGKTLKAASIKVDGLLANPEKLDKTRLTDLSLSVSQIYDKQALASGEPTIISERAEPTPEIIQDIAAKLEKMKQLIKRPS